MVLETLLIGLGTSVAKAVLKSLMPARVVPHHLRRLREPLPPKDIRQILRRHAVQQPIPQISG